MENTILGNRYELIERVGGGGMAIVYKAKCKLLNRYVAVKVLREEFTNDEEFVKRFRVEAQSAAGLSHPNIVSIFDVGQEENIHYIVMEFIDGITLKEYIDRNTRLDWEEAVQIALQICSAIEHAHKNNIIHRDIKPHNIMFTQQGIAKVTDFGIARAVSSATITMVGSTIGSVHYFSPEQARGTITDEQSDIYSLGVTIYEMVAGKVPFNGESPVSVALKHIQEQPLPPSELVEGLPSGINDIIMKAIMKEKERRYRNATDLLADLHEVARHPDARFAVMPAINFSGSPTKRMKAINPDEYNEYDLDEYSEEGYIPQSYRNWGGNRNGNGNGNGNWDGGSEDEEEAKKDKFSITLGVITGVVIVGILLYLAFKIFIPSFMANDDFVIKDYVGEVYEEVEIDLAAVGILSDAKFVYSNTVREGLIISQDPEKDKTLKPGSTINFEVSNGLEMVSVPELFMRESRVAEQMLKDANLVPEVITENSDTVPKGTVIRTQPEANREVRPESVVTVVESLGPKLKQVKVPSLLGRTRTEVEASLATNNLKIGKVTPADIVNDLAKVSEQYPEAGTTVDEGTAVDITYELAQQEEPTPHPEPQEPIEQPGEPTAKTQRWQVKLDDPSKYENEIEVYIEATPSDTNKLIVVFNEKVRKSSFPIVVDIPMSGTGTTHVIVMYDGVIVAENDLAP